MKSAADGMLPEELFEQTANGAPGSHEKKSPGLDKLEGKIKLGLPDELARYHGKDMENGTGRGKED